MATESEVEGERARLRRLRSDWRRFNAQFPDYEVPRRKPPIGTIWYDREDRLWVLDRPAENDEWLKAAVYDGNGEKRFTARWPRGIDLSVGGIKSDVAWGVQRLALDVQRVARLRFTTGVQ